MCINYVLNSRCLESRCPVLFQSQCRPSIRALTLKLPSPHTRHPSRLQTPTGTSGLSSKIAGSDDTCAPQILSPACPKASAFALLRRHDGGHTASRCCHSWEAEANTALTSASSTVRNTAAWLCRPPSRQPKLFQV